MPGKKRRSLSPVHEFYVLRVGKRYIVSESRFCWNGFPKGWCSETGACENSLLMGAVCPDIKLQHGEMARVWRRFRPGRWGRVWRYQVLERVTGG